MARIRTVKPEFWAHPVLGRKSEAARLLALALLNLADDEGYFLADPALVRNFARPYDTDSGSTTVALRELSLSGYLEIREHATHGAIGCVTNFRKHQNINKPSKSKLSQYFESASGSTTVALPESSLPTPPGNGSGIRDQGREGITDLPTPPVLVTAPASMVKGLTPDTTSTSPPPEPLKLEGQQQLVPAPPPTAFLLYMAQEFPTAQADPALEKAWSEAWPALDLTLEAKKAKAWELANPREVKKQKRAFLRNWMESADKRRSVSTSPPRPTASSGSPKTGSSPAPTSSEWAKQPTGRRML